MRRLGGQDDELQKIQKDLKQLEEKEILYGIIQNLKVTLDMKDTMVGISRTLHTVALDQKDEKVLAWLKFVDTSANHDLARKKHETTTGNWFLELPSFQEWTKATKASLWLYGIPGAGKTILCSTIIEHTIKICNSTPFDRYAYFYFDFNEKRTVVSMLSSIIAQLCTQKNAVPVELHQLYKQCDNGQRQPGQTNLLKIFFSLLTTSHRTF